MSNDQSYLDNGTLRDVRVVAFDVEGNMEYGEALGRVATYAEALAMVKNAGYTVAPENEGYDVGADTLHVLEGREGGYVDSYDEYVGKVAAGSVPKG